MLAFFILAVSVALVAAQLVADRKTHVLSPHILFQIYFIIQLPLNLFLGSNFYLPRFAALSPLMSTYDVARLGLYILIGQITFVAIVYSTSLTRGRIYSADPVQAGHPAWPSRWTNYICAAIFLLGYLAYFVLVIINGGFAAFAEAREIWRTQGVGGQGWVLFPATSLIAIAMCAIMVNNRQKFAGFSGVGKLLLLYILAVVPASQLGFRALLFLPLLQIVFFYHSFIRRISGAHLAVGAMLLLTAFTLYGVQREVPYKSTYGTYFEYLYYIYITRPDITYTVVLRSMGADIVQQTIDYLEVFRGHKGLWPILVEAVTIPIPSSIWAGKPEPLSVQFSSEVFGIRGGVSPTILGEGFWHAGILGLIALLGIAGLIHRKFRLIEANAQYDANQALLALTIYPSIIMMAEAFQGYLNGLVLIMIARWLLVRLIAAGAASKAGRNTMMISNRAGNLRRHVEGFE